MGSRRGVDAREHASEERAVSKVVGVVLMTAIVIALAATVATMLTGFAGLLNDPAPQAAFSFEYDDDVGDPSAYHPEIESGTSEIVVVEHIGGDRIDPDQLEIEVTVYDNAESELQSIRVPWSDATGGNVSSVSIDDAAYPRAVGDSTFKNGGSVSVYWLGDNGDRGVIVDEWEP
jgi:flagellin-like protein